jgi:hypothetical protein
MTTFDDISEVCLTWPHRAIPDTENSSTLHTRIAQILRELKDAPNALSTGTGNLVAMLRQLLRETSVKRDGPDLQLVVPNADTPGWPLQEEWEAFSMTVNRVDDQFRVTAREWSPEWEGAIFLRDEYVDDNQHPNSDKPISDPLIHNHFDIKFFYSQSQAEAMRAAHLLPPGHTLVVNLPTGFGKSLLFQTVTIREAVAHGRVSVIVVPTTALAKEQESRLQDMLARVDPSQGATPIAYHADLTSDDKQAFRQRIYDGKQPVIITSPESVLRGLRNALTKRADRGELAWIVIDKVHMLSQWGEDFRSDFQLLAALIQQCETHRFPTIRRTRHAPSH